MKKTKIKKKEIQETKKREATHKGTNEADRKTNYKDRQTNNRRSQKKRKREATDEGRNEADRNTNTCPIWKTQTEGQDDIKQLGTKGRHIN